MLKENIQKWLNKELYLTHKQLKAENRHRFPEISRLFEKTKVFRKKCQIERKLYLMSQERYVIVKMGSYKKIFWAF